MGLKGGKTIICEHKNTRGTVDLEVPLRLLYLTVSLFENSLSRRSK